MTPQYSNSQQSTFGSRNTVQLTPHVSFDGMSRVAVRGVVDLATASFSDDFDKRSSVSGNSTFMAPQARYLITDSCNYRQLNTELEIGRP